MFSREMFSLLSNTFVISDRELFLTTSESQVSAECWLGSSTYLTAPILLQFRIENSVWRHLNHSYQLSADWALPFIWPHHNANFIFNKSLSLNRMLIYFQNKKNFGCLVLKSITFHTLIFSPLPGQWCRWKVHQALALYLLLCSFYHVLAFPLSHDKHMKLQKISSQIVQISYEERN